MAHIEDAAAGMLLDALPDGLKPCPPPHPHPQSNNYWTRHYTSPLKHAGRDGPMAKSCDVLIIGTGLTGTCAASRLVEAAKGDEPLSVVVLDARAFSEGASGRNGGHLCAIPRLLFADLVSMYGLEEALAATELEDRAAAFVSETCEREGWEVDLIKGGSIHLFKDSASVSGMKHQLEAARKAGVDVSAMRWLDRAALLKETGAEAYAGLQIPAANFYPLKFTSALFEQALARSKDSSVSLQLYTHTPVTSVDGCNHPTYRWRVQTSRGYILARSVLHATNGYASSIIPSLASGPDRIVPTRGQVLAYAPWPSSNPRWTTAFSSPYSINYFFQRPNGGPVILGGSRVEAGEPYEFGVSDDSDSQVNSAVESALKRYLPSAFPGWFGGPAKAGDVEESWTGIMGYRVGGVPIVGQVYVDGKALAGQYISAGYSGHGVVRAPVCGQIIADMALAELRGEEYAVPDWMPKHFLTRAEGGQEAKADSRCTVT